MLIVIVIMMIFMELKVLLDGGKFLEFLKLKKN
jgi:hypothetical protein